MRPEGPRGARALDKAARGRIYRVMRRITLSPGPGSEYPSIGSAVRSIVPGEETLIFLKKGVYREKVELRIPGLRIIGEDPEATRLVYDDGALKRLEDGSPMGTFNSFTLLVGAPDIRIEGLTIENSAGDGRVAGQAVALYADADRLSFVGCRLLGCQDTLCTGPLPRDPIPKGVNARHEFEGYDREPVLKSQRQYYENCFIRGDIDFIFGGATAYFNGCEISSRDRGEEVNGFVTAASTYPGESGGFVFSECRFTSEAAEASVYLGRPWRDHARTVLVDCRLGPHIKKEGWHDWDKPSAREASFYAELGSKGPGAADASRPPWVKILEEADRSRYAIERLLSGADGWEPRR
jgi:pectinesterase